MPIIIDCRFLTAHIFVAGEKNLTCMVWGLDPLPVLQERLLQRFVKELKGHGLIRKSIPGQRQQARDSDKEREEDRGQP